MKFPKNIVLSVTLHGSILDQDGKIVEFAVPPDMKIRKISAVAPGVCNVMSEDDANNLNMFLGNVFKDPNISYDKAATTVTMITPLLWEAEAKGLSGLRAQVKAQPSEDVKEYIRSTDKGFTNVEYSSEGKQMLEKFYTRSPEEGVGSAHDYKINIINMAGMPDLFQYMIVGRSGPLTRSAEARIAEQEGVLLSDVINFLYENGVDNIVLFDFSCSTLHVDPRTIRRLRLSARKEGKNGGKRTRRRRYQKKTKPRATKKRLV